MLQRPPSLINLGISALLRTLQRLPISLSMRVLPGPWGPVQPSLGSHFSPLGSSHGGQARAAVLPVPSFSLNTGSGVC